MVDTRITRVTQPIFAATAANIGVFGSGAAGTKELSDDLATLMSLGAWADGWSAATLGASKFPPIEEMNALQFINTTQLAYIFQEGIPAYDAGTIYWTNSVVKKTGTYQLYGSVTDDNHGNALTDAAHWQFLGSLDSIESIIPNNQAAAGYAPVAGDVGKIITRSNAAAAMADTLPGSGGTPLIAGWYCYIQNIDASANDSIGVGAGGSISVGSQSAANAFVVAPGETWLVVSKGAGNFYAMRVAAATLHTRPSQGSRKNLLGAWVSNTTATWTADSIVLFDASNNSKTITAFNKTLNTAIVGAGGMDAAAPGNNALYNTFAIYNPATNTQSILASASATAPTLPAGYTYFARIGTWVTDGSAHILPFKQRDNKTQYVATGTISVPFFAAGATSGGAWQACSVSQYVPPTATDINVNLIATVGSSGQYASAAPNNNYTVTGGSGSTPPLLIVSNSLSGALSYAASADFVLETTNIYYASSVGTAAINLLNYTDSL